MKFELGKKIKEQKSNTDKKRNMKNTENCTDM